MRINQFRSALHATPCQPLLIHLADGRSMPVAPADFAMITGTGRTAHTSRPDDHWLMMIDLLLATQPETKTEMPAP